MEKTIVGGVFRDSDEAIGAIRRLKEMGFDTNDLSIFAKDDDKLENIEDQTDVDVIENDSGRGKNAGKGAGIGAGTGGVLGGIAGLIAEIGLLSIPGIGVLVAKRSACNNFERCGNWRYRRRNCRCIDRCRSNRG